MPAKKSLPERLRELPHLAVVAFASRCARRVQPLTKSLQKDRRDAVDAAIKLAEQVAREGHIHRKISCSLARRPPAKNSSYGAATAAALAADASADSASLPSAAAIAAATRAATEAAHAADYAGTSAYAAVSSDIACLMRLRLGAAGSLGQPIDPSEDGPLGPLWPDGDPEWFRGHLATVIGSEDARELTFGSGLVIEIDVPEHASDEEIVALATRLAMEADDLHRASGGHGLKVDRLEIYDGILEPKGGRRG